MRKVHDVIAGWRGFVDELAVGTGPDPFALGGGGVKSGQRDCDEQRENAPNILKSDPPLNGRPLRPPFEHPLSQSGMG